MKGLTAEVRRVVTEEYIPKRKRFTTSRISARLNVPASEIHDRTQVFKALKQMVLEGSLRRITAIGAGEAEWVAA